MSDITTTAYTISDAHAYIKKEHNNNIKNDLSNLASDNKITVGLTNYSDSTYLKKNLALLQDACNKLETEFSNNCNQANCCQVCQGNQQNQSILSYTNQGNQVNQSSSNQSNQSDQI